MVNPSSTQFNDGIKGILAKQEFRQIGSVTTRCDSISGIQELNRQHQRRRKYSVTVFWLAFVKGPYRRINSEIFHS
jgi:hypothetical protein